MAGTERIELPLTEPESVVLPLDEVPITFALTQEHTLAHFSTVCKHDSLVFLQDKDFEGYAQI